MSSVKCLKCGNLNSSESTTCEACGEKLLGRQEYEQKFQELKDYKELGTRYSVLIIVLSILVLFCFYPFVKWLFQVMFRILGTEFLPALISQYAAPAVILLVFLVAVLPMIWGRWRVRAKYHWTRERMRSLDCEVKSLPKDFFETVVLTRDEAKAPVRKVHGPPGILLAIVFTLVALVFLNKYTSLKPLDSLASLFGIGHAQIVEGEYSSHFDYTAVGPGVAQSEQTWSYVFHSDGTYITYLNGHEQYSGTWSQSGDILTVNVPAVPNISPAYSFQATVSRDGNSFTAGQTKFVKVKR